MKTIINDRAKYIIAILSLTFVCEIMFHINNKLIQMLGMCIIPIIIIYGFLLFKSENNI